MMTFDTTPPKPAAGEVWHVKLPDQLELLTVEVVQSTVLTVQVRVIGDGTQIYRPERYEHGAIKFVEKAK